MIIKSAALLTQDPSTRELNLWIPECTNKLDHHEGYKPITHVPQLSCFVFFSCLCFVLPHPTVWKCTHIIPIMFGTASFCLELFCSWVFEQPWTHEKQNYIENVVMAWRKKMSVVSTYLQSSQDITRAR